MAYIEGSDFSEDIDGTGGNDTIKGFAGDDGLRGFGGNDELFGGSGDDDLLGGTGINNLWGGTGRDYFIVSARSSNTLSDNYIGDFRFGSDKVDVSAWGVSDFTQIEMLLDDNDDDNAVLNAYYGGRNNYIEIGKVSSDELVSSDFAYSTSGAREILGTSNSDVLFGSRSADLIEGGSGNDRLLGGQGNDRIYGDAGNDRIYGGRGQDVMTGNSGSDVFVFAFASETATGTSTRDRITDFTVDRDVIDLSSIDADITRSGSQEFDWIGRNSLDDPGELRYGYSGGRTIIYGNLDDDSSSEFQIALSGEKNLVSDDFYL